jgi:chromosome segregation ATPase
MENRFEDLTETVRQGFIMVDRRLDAFEGSVNSRFDAVDRRFDAIEKRLDAIEVRLDHLEARFDNLSASVSRIEGDIKALNSEMVGIHRVLDKQNTRLIRVEGAVGLSAAA